MYITSEEYSNMPSIVSERKKEEKVREGIGKGKVKCGSYAMISKLHNLWTRQNYSISLETGETETLHTPGKKENAIMLAVKVKYERHWELSLFYYKRSPITLILSRIIPISSTVKYETDPTFYFRSANTKKLKVYTQKQIFIDFEKRWFLIPIAFLLQNSKPASKYCTHFPRSIYY